MLSSDPPTSEPPTTEPARGRLPVDAGPRRARRSAALLFALGIAASACGSGDSTTDAAPADESTSASTGADESTTGANSDEAADTSTTVSPPASSADETEEPAADPGATLANYPQVDVVDLGSGDTVDFAEQVAGGSLPTLIWFWAPH